MSNEQNTQLQARVVEALKELRDSYSGGGGGGYYDRARERSQYVVIEALTRAIRAEPLADEACDAFAGRLIGMSQVDFVSSKYRSDTQGAEGAMTRLVWEAYTEVTGREL